MFELFCDTTPGGEVDAVTFGTGTGGTLSGMFAGSLYCVYLMRQSHYHIMSILIACTN